MCVFNDSINLIKKTNGDILGIILFIIIIMYFLDIKDRNYMENIILFGSIIGLIVDTNTVLNLN